MMLDLLSGARLIEQAVRDLDQTLTMPDDPEDFDPETAVRCLLAIQEAGRDIKLVVEALENRIGESLHGPLNVDGKTVKRHPRAKRTKWHDADDMLRLILDSVLVDPNTGERIDETPLERVKRVWNLAGYNARTTELRRFVDVEDYCETEWPGGYSLEIR